MEKPKFYITTAIAYSSQKPHIGNAYDIVLADCIARYKRERGFDVFFMTGSDEHGQKIEERAAAEGKSPKEFVDGVSAEIRAVWDSLDTSYDKFIRTTDKYHERVVQKIFKKLYDQGDIYKGKYQGKYCVPCESFFTPSQLKDGRCPDCGREVIDASEEAYFLRLSKYGDRLLEHFETHPDFIYPDSRRNEMLNNFIKPGLADLCVSRSSFKWGIPVEFDPGHVIYVWIDALSNYITGAGYDPDGSSENYKKYWPADLHVIGKDIARFHTVYWPIILMALGEPLPRHVLAHPWVLFGEDKMSKSKGNVIYADALAARFGSDAVRYYLLSQMPFAQDGAITYESFMSLYNVDLANTIGNLVNRTIAMTQKYFGGKLEKSVSGDPIDNDLRECAAAACEKYLSLMDVYRCSEATNAVLELARRCNKYIDETTPWVLAKRGENERLGQALYNLLEGIRLIAALLTPVMPQSCKKIFEFLGTDDRTLAFGAADGYSVNDASVLFARLDVEKTIEELTAEAKTDAKPEKPEEDQKEPPLISIDKFAEVKLIAALVKGCEPVKRSKKLLRLTLDDGSGVERTVVSGISEWYKPEDLIGKTVAVVANLAPAVLCGVESRGMILAADTEDGARVIFLDGVAPGSTIR